MNDALGEMYNFSVLLVPRGSPIYLKNILYFMQVNNENSDKRKSILMFLKIFISYIFQKL